MIVLDENIPEDQRDMLRQWRIRTRQIGDDVGYKGMRRLKQRNLGARLHCAGSDLLVAQGPVFPYGGTLRWERIHVQKDGYAERDYHESLRHLAVFEHHSIRLSASQVSDIESALQVAKKSCLVDISTLDPNGTFRTIQFLDDLSVVFLAAEYVNEKAVQDAAAFDAVWDLLQASFARRT